MTQDEGPDGKVPGVDAEGRYLGRVEPTDPQLFKAVPVGPTTADPYRYDFENATWIRVWPVDADGCQCADADGVTLATSRPPASEYRWSVDEMAWVDRRPVRFVANEIRNRAMTLYSALLARRTAEMADAEYQALIVAETQALREFWAGRDADIAALLEHMQALFESIYEPGITRQDQWAATTQFRAATEEFVLRGIRL